MGMVAPMSYFLLVSFLFMPVFYCCFVVVFIFNQLFIIEIVLAVFASVCPRPLVPWCCDARVFPPAPYLARGLLALAAPPTFGGSDGDGGCDGGGGPRRNFGGLIAPWLGCFDRHRDGAVWPQRGAAYARCRY